MISIQIFSCQKSLKEPKKIKQPSLGKNTMKQKVSKFPEFYESIYISPCFAPCW